MSSSVSIRHSLPAASLPRKLSKQQKHFKENKKRCGKRILTLKFWAKGIWIKNANLWDTQIVNFLIPKFLLAKRVYFVYSEGDAIFTEKEKSHAFYPLALTLKWPFKFSIFRHCIQKAPKGFKGNASVIKMQLAKNSLYRRTIAVCLVQLTSSTKRPNKFR